MADEGVLHFWFFCVRVWEMAGCQWRSIVRSEFRELGVYAFLEEKTHV
jgi:hypothetical protein